MTYDKLLRLLQEERKLLDKRITECLKMLVLEGDGRSLVLAVKRMDRWRGGGRSANIASS